MLNDRLEIRRTGNSTAFYIGGSLQFDTEDEHIYHESLVVPAASIVDKRRGGPFEALILGGGDGLALRELIRFPTFSKAVLVDYDAEVLKLGRTEFRSFNRGSLFDSRLTVRVEDANDYIASSIESFDLIIADFTFPDDLNGCRLFTADFFSGIKKLLKDDAVFALNSVSPSASSAAYWSISRTLSASGLYARPMRVEIPSFMAHGYGEWGFFLSSGRRITYKELASINLPQDLKYLNKERLIGSLRFSCKDAGRNFILGKMIREPSDLLCLLNLSDLWDPNGEETACEWRGRAANVIHSLDMEALLAEAEVRIKGASKKVHEEFALLKAELSDFISEKVLDLERSYRCFAILMLLIIFINLVYPDNAFAKGYYGSSHGADEEINMVFLSPIAAAPFRDLSSQTGTAQYMVPDIYGKAHVKRTIRYNKTPAASGEAVTDTFFYAIADDVYLAESGHVYATIANLPYIYKAEPGRFLLLETGKPEPLFEFYPDTEVLQVIVQNISLQQRAAEKAIKEHNKWLAWSGPGQYIVNNKSSDAAAIEKIRKVGVLLQKAYGELSGAKIPPQAPNRSIKIAPGMYLTMDGLIMFRQADGTWVNYCYKGFGSAEMVPQLPHSDRIDKFVKDMMGIVLLRMPKWHPMREMIITKSSGLKP